MGIELPGLEQEIRIDTTSVEKAILVAKRFKSEMDRALKIDTRGIVRDLKTLQQQLDRSLKIDPRALVRDLKTVEQNISKVNKSTGELNKTSDRLGQTWKTLAQNLRQSAAPIRDVTRAVEGLNRSLDPAKLKQFDRAVEQVGRTLGGQSSEFQQFQAGMDRIIRGSRDAQRDLPLLSNAIEDASNAAGNADDEFRRLGASVNGMIDNEDVDDVRDLGVEIQRTSSQARDSRGRFVSAAAAADELGDKTKGAGRAAAAARPAIRGAGEAAERAGDKFAKAALGVGLFQNKMKLLAGIGTVRMLGQVAGFAPKIALLGTVAGGAGAGLAQLTAGLVGLAGPLSTVAGLGAALPGLYGSIGAIGATAGIGFASDTTDEMKKAGQMGRLDQGKEGVKNSAEQLQKSIQSITNPQYLAFFKTIGGLLTGPITEGFRKIAPAVGNAAESMGKFLSSKPFLADFSALMGSSAKLVSPLTRGITSMLKVFTGVATTGIPVVSQLVEGFRKGAENLQLLVQKSRASGQLAAFMQKGLDTGRRLFVIVKDLATGLFRMSQVANQTNIGEALFKGIERGIKGFKNFTTNFRSDFLGAARNGIDLFRSLGQNISTIGKTLFDLGAKVNLSPVLNVLNRIIPLIGDIAAPLSNQVIAGISHIGNAFLAQRGAITSIGQSVGGMVRTVQNTISQIIPIIAGPFETAFQTVDTLLAGVAPFAKTALSALAGPFEDVVKSSAGLVQRVVSAVTPIVSAVAGPIASIIGTVQETIGNIFTRLSGPMTSLATGVMPSVQSAFETLGPPVEDLVVSVGNLVASFSGSFGSTLGTVVGLLTPIFDVMTKLLGAAEDLPEPVKDVVTAISAFLLLKNTGPGEAIFGGLTALIDKVKEALQQTSDESSTTADTIGENGEVIAGALEGTGTAAKNAASAVNTHTGKIRGAFTRLGRGAVAAGKSIASGLSGALGGPVGIALAGITLAMQLFGDSADEAGDAALAQKARMDSLKDSVDQITGSFTTLTNIRIADFFNEVYDNGNENPAKRLFESIGISVGEASDALVAGGPKLTALVDATVKNLTDQYKTLASDPSFPAWVRQQNEELDKAGLGFDAHVRAMAGGAGALQTYYEQVGAATGQTAAEVEEMFNDMNRSATSVRGLTLQAQQLGVSMDDLQKASQAAKDGFKIITDAAAGASNALPGAKVSVDELNAALTDAAEDGTPVVDVLRSLGLTADQQAAIISTLGDKYDATTGKLSGLGREAATAHAALVKVSENANKGIPNATKLAEAFTKLGDEASTAADKANALKDILDIMAGGTQDNITAQAGFYEALATSKTKIDELVGTNKNYVTGLNARKGALNAANAEDRKFLAALDGIADNFGNMTSAAYNNVAATKGQAAGIEAARKAAVKGRADFLAYAKGIGIVGPVAEKMADDLGLIPENVVTAYSLKGVDEVVVNQVSGVIAMLAKIPGKKTVTVQGDQVTKETQAQLEKMGYTVTRLPDGRVRITSNTADVVKDVNTIVSRVKDLKTSGGSITIDSKSTTQAALQRLKDLGYEVKTLPGGKVRITDTIAVTKAKVQNLRDRVALAFDGRVVINSKDTTDAANQALLKLGYNVKRLPDGRIEITSNSDRTRDDINRVTSAVDRVPKGKEMRFTSLTSDAVQRLKDLGYTVTQNAKDKSFTVSATTTGADALARVRDIINGITSKTVTVTTNYQSSGYQGGTGGSGNQANGNVVLPRASGGMDYNRYLPLGNGGKGLDEMVNRAKPMSNKAATIVPRNTPRLIGDNVRVPELFVPLDGSKRSDDLLMQGIQRSKRLGGLRGLQPRILPFATGGMAGSAGALGFGSAALQFNAWKEDRNKAVISQQAADLQRNRKRDVEAVRKREQDRVKKAVRAEGVKLEKLLRLDFQKKYAEQQKNFAKMQEKALGRLNAYINRTLRTFARQAAAGTNRIGELGEKANRLREQIDFARSKGDNKAVRDLTAKASGVAKQIAAATQALTKGLGKTTDKVPATATVTTRQRDSKGRIKEKTTTSAVDASGNKVFNFYQYNATKLTDAQMMSKAMQILAAAGMLG